MSNIANDSKKNIKLQFYFSKGSVERLDNIVEKVSAPSRADVVRRSLTLYEKIIDLLDEKGDFVFEKKNGEKLKIIFADLK